MDDRRSASKRFPLALPPELDRELREWAQGNERRAPTSLNNAIVFVLRAGLKALKESEKEKGQRVPDLIAA